MKDFGPGRPPRYPPALSERPIIYRGGFKVRGASQCCEPQPATGVSRALRARCVPGVSVIGHSGARVPKGPRDTQSDTPSDIPPFRGHSWGYSGDTSGPKGPRDSCSRPGGSQSQCLKTVGFIISNRKRCEG